MDVPKHVWRRIYSQIAAAEGHLAIHRDISQAVSDGEPVLVPFYDFFELTMVAHFSGAFLSFAKVLDRHDDTASIPWLIKHILARSDIFGDQSARMAGVLSKLDTAQELVQKIRRVRNKYVAHMARMSEDDLKAFWDDLNVGSEDLSSLARILRDVMKLVEGVLYPDPRGSGRMFAVENETQDVLTALRFALSNGHVVPGVDPAFFKTFHSQNDPRPPHAYPAKSDKRKTPSKPVRGSRVRPHDGKGTRAPR